MLATLRKLGGSIWLECTGAARRSRRDLWAGRHGLRIATFHDVVAADLGRFRRFLDHAAASFDIVGPEAAATLVAGRGDEPRRDRLLLAFDDGFESNHHAAVILSERGIRGLFFVMPSFVDRSLDEWTAWHRGRGRDAFPIRTCGSRRGLSRTQIREMVAMGHVIGGHNDAHRNLGAITAPAEIAAEIDHAVDGVAEITGAACTNFAFAFGRPRHMTQAAVDHALGRCPLVYAFVRGLNVAGVSPRLLLRDDVDLREPRRFQRLCLAGGVDGLWAPEARELAALAGTLPAAIPGDTGDG